MRKERKTRLTFASEFLGSTNSERARFFRKKGKERKRDRDGGSLVFSYRSALSRALVVSFFSLRTISRSAIPISSTKLHISLPLVHSRRDCYRCTIVYSLGRDNRGSPVRLSSHVAAIIFHGSSRILCVPIPRALRECPSSRRRHSRQV